MSAPADLAALVAAIALHGENLAAGLHAVATVNTQASASAAWVRDGLESVAAALNRIAAAMEQQNATPKTPRE